MYIRAKASYHYKISEIDTNIFAMFLQGIKVFDLPAGISKFLKIHHLVTAHAHHRQTDGRTDRHQTDGKAISLVECTT